MDQLPQYPEALNVFKGINTRRLEKILTKERKELVSMFQDCHLLPKERKCGRCGLECKIINDKTNWAGYAFECIDRTCKKRSSFMSSSFFSGAKLHPDEILRLLYYYSQDTYKYKNIRHELRRENGTTISETTLSDWISFFREVATEALEREPQQIGGVGKIVELDESCLVKFKHHRGRRMAKQVWVFGAVERHDKTKFFACIVERRDKDTLIPLIRENIAPGSIIISDGWASYSEIGSLPEGYQHQVVNHSKFFRDPDTGAHTNTIEGAWMHLKQPLKKAHGRSRSTLIPSLNEFSFRRRFASEDIFFVMLVYIINVYDVNESPTDAIDGYEEVDDE